MAREYKDSGIEWIGQIPKEWKLATLKQIGTYINGYAFKPEDWTDSGKPIIRIQDLTGSMDSPNFYNGELDSKYLVSKGDILVSWAATLDAFIWEKEEGWLNQHIFKALPSCDVNYKFFYWLIKLAMENMNNDNKHGIVMQHVTTKVFGNFAVSIPSVNEQQKIADYLDKVCGEVDEMVALQETMIEELKAYKQSVITEAVTKGLNPNVPMRNISIDWVGEIPEHWEVRRIGRLFRLRDEKNYKPMEEVQLLSLYTGIGVFPHGEQEERGNKAVTVEGYKVVHKDDIVVNIILAWMGAIGVSDYDGVTSPAYDVYIPDFTKVVPHYFHYVFRTKGIAAECYKYGRGIMMMRWRTYSSEFKQISVPYPSIEEQHKIASYLDTKCSEIDSLIALKQAKIEELKEYKKSIIYEYATGKKEVV